MNDSVLGERERERLYGVEIEVIRRLIEQQHRRLKKKIEQHFSISISNSR
jgi:hypothetical protein